MKKKLKLTYAIATVAIAAGALVGAKNLYCSDNLTEIQLENIAALGGDGEVVVGDKIPCFSSSNRDANESYVDCSDCKRIEGWKGKGSEALCTR